MTNREEILVTQIIINTKVFTFFIKKRRKKKLQLAISNSSHGQGSTTTESNDLTTFIFELRMYRNPEVIFKTVVRPAMLYGAGTLKLNKT